MIFIALNIPDILGMKNNTYRKSTEEIAEELKLQIKEPQIQIKKKRKWNFDNFMPKTNEKNMGMEINEKSIFGKCKL